MRAKVLVTATLTAAMSLALLAQGPPAGGGQGRGAGRGPQTPPLIMTSTGWEDGGVIPDKYTQAAGPNAPNPALSWTQVPPGTQSFAIIMNDPEPAMLRHRDREPRLGDRVHRRADERHVKLDVACELGGDVDRAGKDLRVLRNEQHVIESERCGQAD